jgi:D-alanyl-D-alanine carboxypeptidase (penicillin-binding protein 5/6)
VLDPADGEIIASAAGRKQLPIASATKIMTALVVLERLEPNRQVPIAGYQPGNPAESVAGLPAGDTFSVGDLLHALLMASANDAAIELSRARAGSIEAFVGLMNRRAARLGFEHTSFANPIGLDDSLNHSSAEELARLAAELRRNRLARRIVDTKATTLRSGLTPIAIENRNTLLDRAAWVNGIKTGQTFGAGHVLVASGTRGGVTAIATVLGAPSESARDDGALSLLKWGIGQIREKRRVAARRDEPEPVAPGDRSERDGGASDDPSPLVPLALIVVGAIVIMGGLAGRRSRRGQEAP